MPGILDDNTNQNTGQQTNPATQENYNYNFAGGIDPNAKLPLGQTSNQRGAFGQNLSPYLQEALINDPNILPPAQRIQMQSVGDIHGVQLPIFSNGVGQLPLRAMLLNQMPPPPPSVNMKMMGSVLDKLLHAPQADPAQQKVVTNEWNKDVVDGSLQEGLNLYGARVYDILGGAPRTQGEMKYMLDTRKKIEYLNDAANLSKTLGVRLEEAGKQKNVDPEYIKALYDYQNTFKDKDTPFDDKVDKWTKDVSRIQSYDSFKTRADQFLPPNKELIKSYSITPALDANGKPIKGKLNFVATINKEDGSGTYTQDLTSRAQDMMDDDIAQGNTAHRGDLEWYARRMGYLLPHADEQKELTEPTRISLSIPKPVKQTPIYTTAETVNHIVSQVANSKTPLQDMENKSWRDPKDGKIYHMTDLTTKGTDNGHLVYKLNLPAEYFGSNTVIDSPGFRHNVLPTVLQENKGGGTTTTDPTILQDVQEGKAQLGVSRVDVVFGKPYKDDSHDGQPETIISKDEEYKPGMQKYIRVAYNVDYSNPGLKPDLNNPKYSIQNDPKGELLEKDTDEWSKASQSKKHAIVYHYINTQVAESTQALDESLGKTAEGKDVTQSTGLE